MPATTEIATFTLAAGSDTGDLNGAAARILREWSNTMAKQDGVQRAWYGTELENPDKLQCILNWNSKATHENFMTTAAFQTVRDKLNLIHDDPPDVIHIDFQPEKGVSEALSAPITEVATFYYNGSPPETSFEGAKTLLEALMKDGVKIMGWAFGTTHEVIKRDGVRGKGNVLLVGWESMQAHADSHHTQSLKDNIHRLTTPEVKTYEMHHVSATGSHVE